MTVLEAAIYTFILSGAVSPLNCTGAPNSVTRCSNGVTVSPVGDNSLLLSTGVEIRKRADGDLSFSDGTTAIRSASSWIKFSNGVLMRKFGPEYRTDKGFVCRAEDDFSATCNRTSGVRAR